MNTLKFHSDVLTSTNRYSSKLVLPDYPYDADGKFDRSVALDTMLREEYGYVNKNGVEISTEVKEVLEKQFAGKCKHTTLLFTLTKDSESSSFPVHVFQPYTTEDVPMVVELNFVPELPNKYFPIEELMDRKIAVAHICYQDVTSDDGDFSNGIAKLLTDRSDPHAAGKIALWAYAAQLVATYLLENKYTTEDYLYVAGHSRLGKTALLAAAQDTRFCGVLTNCSGCSGAAISREKTGETIEDICRRFPYWFATNYHQYANHENDQPFDQHYMMALIAPRKLCVVTAEEDLWADTDAQYLCAEAADVVYQSMGVEGLHRKNGMLQQGDSTIEGLIAFSKRAGTHFFSRDDWNFFIDFIKSK